VTCGTPLVSGKCLVLLTWVVSVVEVLGSSLLLLVSSNGCMDEGRIGDASGGGGR